MFSITDLFKLIPDSLKQSAVDAIVETVVERGEGLLGDSILNKIKGLRSDAAFRQQLDAGLQRGLQRFIDEYQLQDEDLVAAITQDPALFSTQAVRNALVAIVQQPGHYLVEEQALVGQSFAAVLPERINRERVDQAVFYLLKCLAQELWHLPELQPIYSLEFQRITAESTREQLTVQKAQLAALQSLNSGVREALLQLTDALSEQKQLAAGPAPAALPAPRPAVYHNLPQPDYGEFVGREKELRQIFDLLRPYPQSRHHLIVIDGIGGIGKSALALEVAHRCLHASLEAARNERTEQDHLTRLRQILLDRFNEEELRTLCFDMALDYDMLPGRGKEGKARELLAYLERRNRLPELVELMLRARPDIRETDISYSLSKERGAEQFEAIIWASAKRTVLTGEGIAIRHQNTNTLQDIYRAIAIALEREDMLRAHQEEQAAVVRQTLTRQRTLLLVDNFETIDDETVLNFLQELPTPTKAIVTTRHRINVAYPVRLTGMPWQDAKNLIDQECRKKGTSLSDEEQRRLFDRTGGVPLAMVWSIAQIGFGYGIENVLTRLGNPTSDIARFCFEGTVELLRGKPTHQLLMAAAIFTNSSPRTGLGDVAGLPLLDRDDGLADLEKLSLLNRQGERFALLPLTRAFALSELHQNTTFAHEARQRWIKFLVDLCQEPVGEYYWRYRNYAFYHEGENILDAIDWVYDHGNAPDLFLLSRAAYDYLETIGDWNSIVIHAQRALTLAESIQEHLDIARFNNILGWVYSQRGDYAVAGNYFQIALSNYRRVQNLSGESITLQHQSTLIRKQGGFEQAKTLNDQAWELAESLADGDLKALLEINYGKLARDMGQWSEAWEHFSNVRDYFEARVSESPRDEPLARSVWGHLAIVGVHLGRPQQAKEYCLRSLEYFEKSGTKAFLATAKHRLALAEMALYEFPEAQHHLLEAMEWFDRLGMKPDYAEAKKTYQELRKHLEKQLKE